MDFTLIGNKLSFHGTLDEDCDEKQLDEAVQSIERSGQFTEIVFDLSNVYRANSVGVGIWVRIVNKVTILVKYERTPAWMISQLNLYSNLTNERTSFHWLEAPFFSNSLDDVVTVWLEVGHHLPILSNYEDFEFDEKVTNDGDLEPEFEPGVYFLFLTSLTKT